MTEDNNRKLNTLSLLSQINTKLDVLVQDVRNLMTKLLYAVIALSGATVGGHFVGSPPEVVVASYVALIGGIFLLLYTFHRWRNINWQSRLVRTLFGVHLLFSVSVRTFIFKAGYEPAPPWYPVVNDTLFILLTLALIVTTWRYGGKTKDSK